MKLIMQTADIVGDEKNCLYPHRVEITSAEELQAAVHTDHVCAEYRGGYRNTDNFLRSNVVVMDCDNDHSQNPDEWITPEKLDEMLPDIAYAIAFSRHHMKVKHARRPRPKFHVYFQIEPVTDADQYAALKKEIQKMFPFFDDNALDAARFIYGSETDTPVWHDGPTTIDTLVARLSDESWADGVIPEGSRNATMSRFAGRVLKRLGDTVEAHKAFMERATTCMPPLDDEELDKIWRSAQRFYKKIAESPDYIPPQQYGAGIPSQWEEPIPFSRFTMAQFPTDALPDDIADYVNAVAESTQTPVDMAGAVALSILSVCLQGKYLIQGKSDWLEPLNTYSLIIAMPSERKSAVQHMMLRPLNTYEMEYNQRNAAAVESSKMRKRILEKRQKAIEDKVAKGNAEIDEMEQIAREIAGYVEQRPLQLYVDDITTEKLVSVISANDGRAALISSEGGIFDTLAGIYTKTVNIDVMLKGYSGDPIRVDRIGRESESITNPALTVLLMAQPNVVSAVLGNKTFRGRGLTARFLYCMPVSQVGGRRFDSATVPEELYQRYDRKIVDLLEDEYSREPEIITLSPEAGMLLSAFAEELEPKLVTDYSEIADWAGKLVGNILRIAGLLCRASVLREDDFLDEPDPLIVDAATMSNAIRLGRYFLNHAMAAYDALPEKPMILQANRILEMITERKLTEFDRRTAMRYCRTFKTVSDIQPVLDFLDDYGYIVLQPTPQATFGRPPLPKYTVNPLIENVFCPFVTGLSRPESP